MKKITVIKGKSIEGTRLVLVPREAEWQPSKKQGKALVKAKSKRGN